MPFPRRGRRRPPFLTSRWQRRTLDSLRLYLAPAVRSTLTAWMKIYGETNELPGLATGPIEVRFRRLCENAGADTFLLWTTPDRWAAGEGLSLWIPAIGLDLECRFDDGRLHVDKAKPTTAEDRDPRKQRAAVGMELHPAVVELPSDADDEVTGPGLEGPFERMLGRRFHGFVGPLREALEAEARDDLARAERLATTYQLANPRIGGPNESDPYRLAGIDAGAVGQFDEGEWLDLVDSRGRVISSARLVKIDPAEGVMDVDVRGAEPPSPGTVRPRPQTQILAQKRAILDELDNPTGGLRDAVRLVASPASLPIPRKVRPQTFVNKLVMQNRSQTRAVSLALGLDVGQALMIQGPPGTGKSTTLAEILGQLVLRDPTVTVLVCSHSNHGVDNLLLKTLPYLDSVPGLQIARVGLFDRVHPQARKHFVPPGEDLGEYNVVFTTVDALALQAEAGARQYDYAVLDEANRASILDSLIPLVRGRRFILVGDHLQLQPVLSEAEEQLRLEPAAGGNNSAIGKSLFAWLRDRRFPEAACVFLDEQNRMHPVIAGLISEVFYEGKLRSGRRAPRRAAHVPLFNVPVNWVDTHGLHGLREARGRGASLVNVPEARLVATIARHFLGSAQPNAEVGVIAAYAEQTALLRRLLRPNRAGAQAKNGQQKGAAAGMEAGAPTAGQMSQGSPNGQAAGPSAAAVRKLEIDTVDAFEGREKDIIIVSLVRSNRRRDIGFLRLMQRINVALSRARTMLIIVGDTATLRGSYFDRIVRYVRANGALVPGPRLIGRLLNARTTERPQPVRTQTATPRRRGRPLPRPLFPEGEVPIGVPSGAVAPDGRPGGQEDAARARRKRRRRRVRGRTPNDRPGMRPIEAAGTGPAANTGAWAPDRAAATGTPPADAAPPAGPPPELGVVRRASTPFLPFGEPPPAPPAAAASASTEGAEPRRRRSRRIVAGATTVPTPPEVTMAAPSGSAPSLPAASDVAAEAAMPRRRTRRATSGADVTAAASAPASPAPAETVGPAPSAPPSSAPDQATGAGPTRRRRSTVQASETASPAPPAAPRPAAEIDEAAPRRRTRRTPATAAASSNDAGSASPGGADVAEAAPPVPAPARTRARTRAAERPAEPPAPVAPSASSAPSDGSPDAAPRRRTRRTTAAQPDTATAPATPPAAPAQDGAEEAPRRRARRASPPASEVDASSRPATVTGSSGTTEPSTNGAAGLADGTPSSATAPRRRRTTRTATDTSGATAADHPTDNGTSTPVPRPRRTRKAADAATPGEPAPVGGTEPS